MAALLRRAVGGRDRGRARLPARHGQVAHVARARAAAHGAGGRRWLTSSGACGRSRPTRSRPRPTCARRAARIAGAASRPPRAERARGRRTRRAPARRRSDRASAARAARPPPARAGPRARARARAGRRGRRRAAAREAVLDWLGLASVRVERVPRLPDLPGAGPPDLGERVGSVAGGEPPGGLRRAAPDALGAPDGVFVTRDAIVSLVYEPRPGLPRDAPDRPRAARDAGARPRARRSSCSSRPARGTRRAGARRRRARPCSSPGAPHGLTSSSGPTARSARSSRASRATRSCFERDGLVIRLEGRFDRERRWRSPRRCLAREAERAAGSARAAARGFSPGL